MQTNETKTTMTQPITDDYTFSVIPLKELLELPEFVRLTEMHHAEIDPHGTALNIQWDKFIELNKSGNFTICIVDYEYEIVGYCGMSVYTNIQYNEVQAKQAALYIKPEHRGGVGTALINTVDNFLRDNGVMKVTHSVPKGQKWANALLKQDYREIETNYMKDLKNGK